MPTNTIPQNQQQFAYFQQPQPSPQLPTPPTKIPWHILDKRMIIPLLVIIVILCSAFFIRYLWPLLTAKETVVEETPQPSQGGPFEPTEPVFVSECRNLSKTQSDSARDECFFKLANDTKSVNICEEILQVSGPVSVDSCYSMLAVETGHFEYCHMIESFYGDYSVQKCISDFALAEGNPGRCLTLSPEEEKYTIKSCASQFNLTESELTELYGPVPG